MSDALRNPYFKRFGQAVQSKISDALQLAGKALPCSVVEVDGSIVTVQFEVTSDFTLPRVMVPVLGSEYIRAPIQAGCKGVVFACDASIGGMSGLGTGTANLTQPANLTALVFTPIGNTGFAPVDPDTLTLYGPAGVTIQDQAATSVIAVTNAGISMTFGGHSVVINASGVIIDGVPFLIHTHVGVTTGTGVTGPVVP